MWVLKSIQHPADHTATASAEIVEIFHIRYLTLTNCHSSSEESISFSNLPGYSHSYDKPIYQKRFLLACSLVLLLGEILIYWLRRTLEKSAPQNQKKVGLLQKIWVRNIDRINITVVLKSILTFSSLQTSSCQLHFIYFIPFGIQTKFRASNKVKGKKIVFFCAFFNKNNVNWNHTVEGRGHGKQGTGVTCL